MASRQDAKHSKWLRVSLDRIPDLRYGRWESPEFMEWERSTRIKLTHIFPSEPHDDELGGTVYVESEQVRAFVNIDRDDDWHYRGDPDGLDRALDKAEALLRSIIDTDLQLGSVQRGATVSASSARTSAPRRSETKTGSCDVFLVHGRDDGAKEAVARFVEKLGFSPAVLSELPGEGRTIIEKFEDHATVRCCAIVLLTSDDHGALRGEKMRPRARQNVIFELGFFVGKLGRGRVVVLTKGEPEIPSDYSGVEYVRMDSGDDWKMGLLKEMKAAGLNVDANEAFG